MKLFCLPDFSEYDFDKWGELIEKTNLTEIEKQATRSRVISVVLRLRSHLSRLTWSYNILRTTTTVGSVLVPSLLAFQNADTLEITSISMWGVGLAVTLSNAFISLFRVDKHYYTIGTLLEKIESEAWMFLTQCGYYEQSVAEGILGEGHRASFHRFMERCELLINKAVRTEYTPAQAQRHGMSSSASVSSVALPSRLPLNEPSRPLRQANIRETNLYHERPPTPTAMVTEDDLDQVETSSEVVDVSVDERPRASDSNHRHRDIVRTPHSSSPGRDTGDDRGVPGSDNDRESDGDSEPSLKVVVRQDA
jgi:hypothetical protein